MTCCSSAALSCAPDRSNICHGNCLSVSRQEAASCNRVQHDARPQQILLDPTNTALGCQEDQAPSHTPGFCTHRHAPWAAASRDARITLDSLASRFPQFVCASLDVEGSQANEAIAWQQVCVRLCVLLLVPQECACFPSECRGRLSQRESTDLELFDSRVCDCAWGSVLVALKQRICVRSPLAQLVACQQQPALCAAGGASACAVSSRSLHALSVCCSSPAHLLQQNAVLCASFASSPAAINSTSATTI